MLTDRPDVSHTLLGRLKKPKWAFWGQTQERAYSLKVILNPEVCVIIYDKYAFHTLNQKMYLVLP